MKKKKILGCDIGGVLKESFGERSIIPESLEGIKKLSEFYEIVFISKCKKTSHERKNIWMKENNLINYKKFYCEEYKQKLEIAKQNNVELMIDDRIQVLELFPNEIIKIWFCNDEKLIMETKEKNITFYDNVKHVANWKEILNFLIPE